METADIKMLKILKELKEKYYVKSIKLEFEAEGSSFEEAEFLKNMAEKSDLELTIKTGGCEAIRDINDTKKLKADNIIAPMAESKYALKKFVNAVNNIFSETELKNKKLFINIESVTGYKNLMDIIESEDFEKINGIILGRSDMAGSLGFDKNYINSKEIFDISSDISKKMEILNKKFVVGGGVLTDSVDFFKKLPFLTEFETRKIIFDAKILEYNFVKEGILKAIEFEIEWLKSKNLLFNNQYKQDLNRINFLEKYYNESISKLNI